MKTNIFLFTGLLLLLFSSNISSSEVINTATPSQKGAIRITCNPDLYNLTSKWASEYACLNPDMKIEVIKANATITDDGKDGDLRFISNNNQALIMDETNWKMVLGRDVIVPVINSGNPFIKEIVQRGLSPQQFARIIKDPQRQNWGDLLAGSQDAPVHLYLINDESMKSALAKFMQLTQVPMNGITVGTREEMIEAIQKDPYAIGFSSVLAVTDPANQSLIDKIRLLPIDRNGNGRIDYMEDIYTDPTSLMQGVWVGKYPKSLACGIYAVSKVQPSNEAEVAFLRWVITDGQQFLNSAGYNDLVNTERQSQLDKINTVSILMPPSDRGVSLPVFLLLLVAALIILSIIINSVVHRLRNRKPEITGVFAIHSPAFDENSVIVPKGLYFDRTHTWTFMEKDGTVKIGIDDFLQHITGPVTRVDMKKTGEKIRKGDLLFSIVQLGKQLNIYSPVSGIIKEQNKELETKPSCINSSPYAAGWVILIEPTNWLKEIQLLDMAEKYKLWLTNEFSRIKDFLAATLKPDSPEYACVVLQDGGVLKDNILADFGPEVWEDFQTNFLDTYK